MTNTVTALSYDFYYTADGEPWFCSFYTSIMVDCKCIHSELVQSNDLADFERLRKNAIEAGFEKDYEYTNPTTGVRGETYRKLYGVE